MFASRETRRRTKGGLSEETTLLPLTGVLIALIAGGWVALTIGSWLAGLPATGDPVSALLDAALGTRPWPWQSSVIAVILLAAATVTGRGLWRSVSGVSEVDAAARTMARPSTITLAREADNLAANKRLLAAAPPDMQTKPGPFLGETVVGRVGLYLPAELGCTICAGTRTGKTMVWAIPFLLDAWGPSLATSNKPDLYRHTLAERERRGRIWLCDLQAVTGTAQLGFWVNLLASVDTLPAARKLASFFISASSGTAAQAANARVDSYFDGGAQELLSLYLLAAASARGDLLHVAEWLGRDQDQTPVLILRHAGHDRAADRVLESQALYARQRDGLYDMARRFLNTLSDEGYARLVTPPRRRRLRAREADLPGTGTTRIVVDSELDDEVVHSLPEFKPVEFVRSDGDTLYALSMSGADSATPLTAALVGQILEAGLQIARARPDGRLRIPLTAVLDEAANCARIGELPSYYTYAGGCGIMLITILQVIEQGEDLWGVNGLRTMRAQSIEIYGGGIAVLDYLEQWSKFTGDHDVADRSRSRGPGGVQRSLSWRAEPILSVAELAALPKDRALVRLPGHKPLLVRKRWWTDSQHAGVITESLARFENQPDPEEATTLSVADTADTDSEGDSGEGERGW
ncbi:type IV secretory system conjugative DNA transfer family protein [Nocardia bhagyanarayanae]|uniref:TraM-binding TraD/TraG-like protein n=1 Tax=Nocardia bhagyanarayanae TaxID=1215925 RepID=A0A543FFP6_9NOCA|nr:TraM recognition domain-containing protein [Nocardia bhagyanarayanae]TQM32693.1 TraM-binding TraD/TraG-like protein [Nocardia bhagyanarayanae]